ncbi:HDOD domain-containing protein [Vibrio sp. SA48]|uniref:EAL and HDOD domain-containing protein n=1 Tax=Vibrio TaxID=662 RepID=UPI0015948C1A|nr:MULTISPECIES: EAL and HDOD domain-containing protein [Vibrio]MBD1566251.1 HDOD domain-containing protein [Vibrio sp. S12_S33]MDE1309644.1 HDOD domain-containing protein [Vibrio aestuarianus]NGZ92311.1 HDOD domain-containing protein [Vibrio aestuarianus subsp. cardii]
MYYTYVARQPILNAKQHTLGYELLFRDGENNAFPAHIESNRATYRLIVENFLSVGMNPAIGKSRCFINFPYKSLIRRLPLTLPRDQIVVEVLETCTPSDELLDAIKDLYTRGYIVALDDFVYSPEWERFLPYIHIVKLDIMALGLEEACEFVRKRIAEGSKRRFLAERVETEHEFNVTRSAGFAFFQGYFFSRPQIIKQRYVSPEQIIALELFREVCKLDVDFERIECIISQDIALSYKLLRFVNTMSDRLSMPISSFRQALIYLGQDRLKMFISLAVASFVSSKKPKELYNLSLQRAKFCQLMASHHSLCECREQAFLIGLFSVLDALLDISIEELVEQLQLSDAVKIALQRREGPIGELLALEECFEQADWQGVEAHCDALGLELGVVSDELSAALRWSQDVNRLI